jgi:hypothetical protein
VSRLTHALHNSKDDAEMLMIARALNTAAMAQDSP